MYYDYFDTGLIGTLTLVGDGAGLRHIQFEEEKRALTIEAAWERKPAFFKPLKTQLRAYFTGALKRFELPLALTGTAFQLKVWQALQEIPYGEVASYGDVAKAIGNPKAVRAVGGANARNPIPVIIPCHRVIGSDGSLTGFGGGLTTKQRLLDLERGRGLS
jgi:methylated-DNA-[protein]-cysteine S-methyltransferase